MITIDLNQIDAQGFVKKNLLVDLLNIPDPNNLGGNGTTNGVFTFPFLTTEAILPVDSHTLLIVNDNNYPFSDGRTPGQPDNSEFILVDIGASAAVPEPASVLGFFALGALGLGSKLKQKVSSRQKGK